MSKFYIKRNSLNHKISWGIVKEIEKIVNSRKEIVKVKINSKRNSKRKNKQ